MHPMMRDTGADSVGKMPWGTHLCEFYHTRQDLLNLLIPFLRSGLNGNELCVWVASSPIDQDLARRVSEQSVRTPLKGGNDDQLLVYSHVDWYMESGSFSPEKALGNAVQAYDRSQDQGYEGLRLTGNISWLPQHSWVSFAEYEAEVNEMAQDRRVMILCTYPLDGCSSSQIEDVVANHGCVLCRSTNWRLGSSRERTDAARELVAQKHFRDALLGLNVDGRVTEIEQAFEEALARLHDRERWASVRVMWEAAEKLADKMESWSGKKMEEVVGDVRLQSLMDDLAEMHGWISGASVTRARTHTKRATLSVEGCRRLSACRSGSTTASRRNACRCFADLAMAAILQRAAKTPLRIETTIDRNACLKTITPAWFIDMLTSLEGLGVEGVVILSGDRVHFSDIPSDADAKALSEALITEEEARTSGGLEGGGLIDLEGRKLISVRFGGLWVSATLGPDSDPDRAYSRLSEAVRRASIS